MKRASGGNWADEEGWRGEGGGVEGGEGAWWGGKSGGRVGLGRGRGGGGGRVRCLVCHLFERRVGAAVIDAHLDERLGVALL